MLVQSIHSVLVPLDRQVHRDQPEALDPQAQVARPELAGQQGRMACRDYLVPKALRGQQACPVGTSTATASVSPRRT